MRGIVKSIDNMVQRVLLGKKGLGMFAAISMMFKFDSWIRTPASKGENEHGYQGSTKMATMPG
jgi:hypothetical protein